MIRRGILTRAEYAALPAARRRHSGGNVSFRMLATSTPATPQEILDFEDISFTLRMSNGTFRTTFRHRFDALNLELNKLLAERFDSSLVLRAEDRAVSHGLTSYEWALALRQQFPNVELQASDLLLHLLELTLPDGAVFITEPSGHPLQYIKAPYAVSLTDIPSWKFPVNRWVAQRALARFASLKLPANWPEAGCNYPTRRIPYIHPEALALSQSSRTLSFVPQSVFEVSPVPRHVVRTMNILNLSYFSEDQLREAVRNIAASMTPDGVWIVGRTTEDNFVNNVSVFVLGATGWQLLRRFEKGSEIESLVLSTPLARS